MASSRTYRRFTCRDAGLRICCDRFQAVTAEIRRQRRLLEAYIRRHPEFGTSFVPIEVRSDAPDVARRMARAAAQAGVGPMAAVAGAMAQLAAEAGLRAGAAEAIVDNGGDIYLQATEPVSVSLDSGETDLADRLAFEVTPGETPLAICSSSGTMGRSESLGQCNLATVVAPDAALADAAATRAANLVKTPADVDSALEAVMAIEGVSGVLMVKGARVGLAGRLPRLVRNPAHGPASKVPL